MFVIDTETLGLESTSVVLSAAILYVDITKKNNTIESLHDDSLFVKFKVREQVEKYKRTTDSSTIAWWATQCDNVKKLSYYPSTDDVPVITGINYLKNFIKSFSLDPSKDIIWARGNLDGVVLESLCRATEQDLIMQHWTYRDIRTFCNLSCTTSNKGYADIDLELYPEYDRNKLSKHDPVSDIILDALILLYGK